VFGYNESVIAAKNSGNWKRSVFGCDHYLAAGEGGKIFFENIGQVNDVITILAQPNSQAGSFSITSTPGSIRNYYIWPDNALINQTITFNPGNFVLRGIINLGLNFGSVAFLLIAFLLIPRSLIKRTYEVLTALKKNILHFEIQQFIRKILNFLDSKRGSTIAIVLIYIAGVSASTIVTNSIGLGPTHFSDETRYWETARSIYNGVFTTSIYFKSPPFYPIVLTPAFYFFYPSWAYYYAKFLNSIFLTSAIFPAYLLLNRFTNRHLSIIAIVLMALNPIQLIIPGRILSENIFYPIFFWALLFAFTNVLPINRRNRIIECLALGILLGLLFLTRYIALVLIPAFLLTWWLRPFDNEKLPFLFSIRKAIHFVIILIPVVLIISIWVRMGVNEGLRAKDMLGLFIAESPNPSQLSLSRLIMWAIFYFSYTILIAAPYISILAAGIMNFKLKDWQKDANRWIIVMVIITLSLLAACIRHSWRINYNFPIPEKLQGRYLMYFGPLFLITTFTLFKRQFKPIDPMKLFIFSAAMISISISILFKGFLYLDGPLNISRSSPDGYLFEALGILFTVLILANVLLNSLLINKKKAILFTSEVLFLSIFFLFGNIRVFQNILDSTDLRINSQIYHLVQIDKELFPDKDINNKLQMNLILPGSASSRQMKLISENLKFNGYEKVNIRLSNANNIEPSLVFQAKKINYSINLREITKREYKLSTNKKYSLSGKYFEYLIEPNN